MASPTTLTIIGTGRFAGVLAKLFGPDFTVQAWGRDTDATHAFAQTYNITAATDLATAYTSQTIVYAVPISAFAAVLEAHKEYIRPGQVLVDTLSVKVYPAQVMQQVLAGMAVEILLTHPLFGPDSVGMNGGFADLPLMIDQCTASQQTYQWWLNYFARKQLEVLPMTADEHDRLAAKSQSLTHFVGRLLDKINMQPTPIDTVGAKKLLDVKQQTCNDTWQLFVDLETKNPYTKAMMEEFRQAYEDVVARLEQEQT